MPYISAISRDRYAEALDSLPTPGTPGDLNYLFSVIAKRYAEGGGYRAINDVMGAFSGAQAEFYRRFAAPYEDAKLRDNGDF